MKKLFILLIFALPFVAEANTLTIDSFKYRASDTSVLIYCHFDTAVSGLTDLEYSFNAGAMVSSGSTNQDTLRIKPANGFTSIQIQTVGITPKLLSNLFTCPSALPVTWAGDPVVRATEAGIVFFWATASEKSTDSFFCQVAGDDFVWKTVAAVKAAGNSTTIKNYTASAGIFNCVCPYGRVIQTDLDGTKDSSKIVTIRSGTASVVPTSVEKFQFYPNPTKDFINFNTPFKESIEIKDLSGRSVLKVQPGTTQVDCTSLPPGVYFLGTQKFRKE